MCALLYFVLIFLPYYIKCCLSSVSFSSANLNNNRSEQPPNTKNKYTLLTKSFAQYARTAVHISPFFLRDSMKQDNITLFQISFLIIPAYSLLDFFLFAFCLFSVSWISFEIWYQKGPSYSLRFFAVALFSMVKCAFAFISLFLWKKCFPSLSLCYFGIPFSFPDGVCDYIKNGEYQQSMPLYYEALDFTVLLCISQSEKEWKWAKERENMTENSIRLGCVTLTLCELENEWIRCKG